MRVGSTAPSRCWRNILPQVAEPVRQAAAKITPLKARATLAIEPVSSTNLRGDSKVKLGARRHRRRVAHEVRRGSRRRYRGADAAGVSSGRSDRGDRRHGADRLCSASTARSTVDKRPGALNVAIRSAAAGDATLDARLTAGGLRASANGTARLFSASGLAAALDLTLQSRRCRPAAPRRRRFSRRAASRRAERQAQRDRKRFRA